MKYAPEIIAKAREMRAAGAGTMLIVRETGMKQRHVTKATADIEYDRMAWVKTARALREAGKSYEEIRVEVDRSVTQILQFCGDIVCPVNHRQEASKRNVLVASKARLDRVAVRRASEPPKQPKEKRVRDDSWKAVACQMRLVEKRTIREIAAILDKPKSSVTQATSLIRDQLPKREKKVKEVKPPRVKKVKVKSTPSVRGMGSVASQTIHKFPNRSFKARTSKEAIAASLGTNDPAVIAFEKKRRELRQLLDLDRAKRPYAPVSLPKLNFMR